MRQNNLLLSFLPGFAPILIYIAVEAAFGETAGLVAGMALGIGEFVFILIRERRVDAFSLADTILLAFMGVLSWSLSDPVFFRLKPAVSGAVLALMMLVGSLGPHRFFLPYMEKKTGLGELPASAARRMLAMIAGFGFLTLAHSALTAIAALFWSKAAWNFVAGVLFWILALLYMAAWMVPPLAAILLAKRRNRAMSGAVFGKSSGTADTAAGTAAGIASGGASGTSSGAAAAAAGTASGGASGSANQGAMSDTALQGEMLPVVDETGRIIGKAPRSLCHAASAPEHRLLHPVVRLWLSDGKGGYWMQKRAASRLVQPGKWDCAVGGHVSFGENAEASLRREAFEEIGLADFSTLNSFRPLFRFVWESPIERELVFVFLAELPSAEGLRVDSSEVDELRLWSAAEIRNELDRDDSVREFTELARVELRRGLR